MKASVYRVSASLPECPTPRVLLRVSDWGTLRAARQEAARINQSREPGLHVAKPARMDGYPHLLTLNNQTDTK